MLQNLTTNKDKGLIAEVLKDASEEKWYITEITNLDPTSMVQEIFDELEKTYIHGITFSGGDPLYKANVSEVTAFAKEIKEKFPHKNIWLYTGFKWEEICNMEIVSYLDVLVDGRFEIDKKDNQLHWRGSANQRVIDVPETLTRGEIKLHEENS